MNGFHLSKESLFLYGKIFASAISFLSNKEYHFTKELFISNQEKIDFSALKKSLVTYYERRHLFHLPLYKDAFIILNFLLSFLINLDYKIASFIYTSYFLKYLNEDYKIKRVTKSTYYRRLNASLKALTEAILDKDFM